MKVAGVKAGCCGLAGMVFFLGFRSLLILDVDLDVVSPELDSLAGGGSFQPPSLPVQPNTVSVWWLGIPGMFGCWKGCAIGWAAVGRNTGCWAGCGAGWESADV